MENNKILETILLSLIILANIIFLSQGIRIILEDFKIRFYNKALRYQCILP